jgi:hypothetical protein
MDKNLRLGFAEEQQHPKNGFRKQMNQLVEAAAEEQAGPMPSTVRFSKRGLRGVGLSFMTDAR